MRHESRKQGQRGSGEADRARASGQSEKGAFGKELP